MKFGVTSSGYSRGANMLGKKTLHYAKTWNDFLKEFPNWLWWTVGIFFILSCIVAKGAKGG
jgi:hypothetical protein